MASDTRLPQQGAVAAHPALQQQDDCQEEEPRKEQEGPRPRRARAVRGLVTFLWEAEGGVVAQARRGQGRRQREERGGGLVSQRVRDGYRPRLTSRYASNPSLFHVIELTPKPEQMAAD